MCDAVEVLLSPGGLGVCSGCGCPLANDAGVCWNCYSEIRIAAGAVAPADALDLCIRCGIRRENKHRGRCSTIDGVFSSHAFVEPAPRRTAKDFASALLNGVRDDGGLRWTTLEDLFQLALDEGARRAGA